jgi:DNA uptake protein ComE-like DNA-binding protein
MRSTATYVMVAALAGFLGACSMSSMEKKYKDVTGSSDKEETRVELNSAGRKRLAALPGLNGDDADRIIAHRPYDKKVDLVKKNVLTQAQFDKVRSSVYVDHEKD